MLAFAACLAQIAGFNPFAAAAAEHPKPGSEPLSVLLAATFKITNKDFSGTCFLLEPPPVSRWSNGVVIVVTAAHALEQAPAGTECLIVLRERRADGSFVRREVPLPIRSGGNPLWVKPPDDDVAALKLTLPMGVTCQPLRLDQLARAEDFTNGRIRLGKDIWVFCFPAQLEANGAGLPVLRHGSIASLPLRPLASDRTFLVDCTTFGGDSGAPVMVEERGATRPAGVIVGLVVGMERETDKVTMPFEERTVHHPLGLAIVAHSEIIRQTVERLLK